MSYRFDCPECGKSIKVPDGSEGKKGTCPGCQKRVVIPAAPRDLVAPPIARPTVIVPEPVRVAHQMPAMPAPQIHQHVTVQNAAAVAGGRRKFCPECDKFVPATKEPMNNLLHFAVTLVSCGAWMGVWVFLALNRTFRCPFCGSRAYGSKTMAKLEPVLKVCAAMIFVGTAWLFYSAATSSRDRLHEQRERVEAAEKRRADLAIATQETMKSNPRPNEAEQVPEPARVPEKVSQKPAADPVPVPAMTVAAPPSPKKEPEPEPIKVAPVDPEKKWASTLARAEALMRVNQDAKAIPILEQVVSEGKGTKAAEKAAELLKRLKK